MAEVHPFRALHYDLERVGGLQAVVAPPYDVIDDEERAALVARSPYNVVEIDLPRAPQDPYAHAAAVFNRWREEGVLVRDPKPAVWALEQDYTGPDGRRRTRRGFFARVRVEDYGPGRIRPHERTHPGPREDRLRLTRATNANLSPIFSLYDGDATPAPSGDPWAEVTDGDGTTHRLWRVENSDVTEALSDAELLIADGHHRYETARVHHQEGGAGHVLMCLVALQDPGLTVFPTHRLLTDLGGERRDALRETIQQNFDITEITESELEPTGDGGGRGRVQMGYLDAHHRRPLMLTLRDPQIAADALPDKPEPYRRLDTAVLEALVLKRALAMTEDDIDHLNGLEYARGAAQARQRIDDRTAEAAFFMRATPIAQVRDVAAAGESMPPKSTYFFPKVLTGMVFNLLED